MCTAGEIYNKWFLFKPWFLKKCYIWSNKFTITVSVFPNDLLFHFYLFSCHYNNICQMSLLPEFAPMVSQSPAWIETKWNLCRMCLHVSHDWLVGLISFSWFPLFKYLNNLHFQPKWHECTDFQNLHDLHNLNDLHNKHDFHNQHDLHNQHGLINTLVGYILKIGIIWVRSNAYKFCDAIFHLKYHKNTLMF